MDKLYDDMPSCYGAKKKGRRCPDCEFENSCKFYEASENAIKSRDKKFSSANMFATLDGRDFSTNYIKNKLSENKNKYITKDNKYVDSTQINLDLITWAMFYALENPKMAKIFALSLNPNVKNCSDISEILGITRQGLNKSLRVLFNLDKKKVPDSSFKKLNKKEFEIYQLYTSGKYTLNDISNKIKMSKRQICRYIKSIKDKGIPIHKNVTEK